MRIKKKSHHFVVQNIYELADLFDSTKRDEVPIAVVEIIESNMDNRLEVINEISIHVVDFNAVFNIHIHRNQFLKFLEELLRVFESKEKYEMCARILKLVHRIKAGSIVESVRQFKDKT